jgi:formyltetrahydrofolate-dependent phosphoribosylglycinamide formyltransferase
MRIGVMCSGNGTNFENIVRTCREDEVVLMVHNKRECGAKKRAIKLGIPHVYIKSANEDEIIKLLQAWRVDLIVLTGWMRIVSPKLIDAFPNRIINIHPSLLPKYKGLNAIGQALESGDTITGCTVHYVTKELDSGEIIEQSIVNICSDDTMETLSQRIQRAEHRLLPMVINNLI